MKKKRRKQYLMITKRNIQRSFLIIKNMVTEEKAETKQEFSLSVSLSRGDERKRDKKYEDRENE